MNKSTEKEQKKAERWYGKVLGKVGKNRSFADTLSLVVGAPRGLSHARMGGLPS